VKPMPESVIGSSLFPGDITAGTWPLRLQDIGSMIGKRGHESNKYVTLGPIRGSKPTETGRFTGFITRKDSALTVLHSSAITIGHNGLSQFVRAFTNHCLVVATNGGRTLSPGS
jgi:hypothetical protein